MKVLVILCAIFLQLLITSAFPEVRVARSPQLANAPEDPARTPQTDEEETDDEPEFRLFGQGRNTFFPISFNGAHSLRARQVDGAEQGYAGVPLAIANSFSTGKSGISNSHAMSFPSAASFARSKRSAQSDELTPPEANAEEIYSLPYSAPQEVPAQGRGRANFATNTFFPITFNGYGRNGASGRQTQGAQGGYGGYGSTSIANSLATGRSGVANSYATAFGDPNAAAHFNRSKRSPQAYQPQPEEDEEAEDAYGFTPSFKSSRGNTFFPITFNSPYGYGASARNTEGGSGYYGGTTAIANSFSTGAKGVANSRATAFADPAAARFFLKNGDNPQ